MNLARPINLFHYFSARFYARLVLFATCTVLIQKQSSRLRLAHFSEERS